MFVNYKISFLFLIFGVVYVRSRAQFSFRVNASGKKQADESSGIAANGNLKPSANIKPLSFLGTENGLYPANSEPSSLHNENKNLENGSASLKVSGDENVPAPSASLRSLSSQDGGAKTESVAGRMLSSSQQENNNLENGSASLKVSGDENVPAPSASLRSLSSQDGGVKTESVAGRMLSSSQQENNNLENGSASLKVSGDENVPAPSASLRSLSSQDGGVKTESVAGRMLFSSHKGKKNLDNKSASLRDSEFEDVPPLSESLRSFSSQDGGAKTESVAGRMLSSSQQENNNLDNKSASLRVSSDENIPVPPASLRSSNLHSNKNSIVSGLQSSFSNGSNNVLSLSSDEENNHETSAGLRIHTCNKDHVHDN